MKDYELLLKEHSLKVTPQRVGIMQIIGNTGHISIEDLFDKIRKRFSNISLATLYKNIHAMIDVTLLKEVKIPNGKSKYEITKAQHSHMVCKECHKVEDIELELDGLVAKASQLSGYTFEENTFVLSGICPECRSKM